MRAGKGKEGEEKTEERKEKGKRRKGGEGGKGRGREWTPQGFSEMTPLGEAQTRNIKY